MSQVYWCYECGEQLPGGATGAGVCADCTGKVAERDALKTASKLAATARAVPVVAWETDLQTASAILPQSPPALGKRIGEYIGAVMNCLTEHRDDDKASATEDQYTIWDGGATVTVDYQGTRAGSGGSLWIDLQGQIGSKRTSRETYWQIMVECSATTPAQGLVQAAIMSSLGGVVGTGAAPKKGQRAVMHLSTTNARPK